MNFNIKKEWPLLAIIAIPFVAALIIYPEMPEQIPIHWNSQGIVDNYGSKTFGTFFLPVLNIVMYVLFLVLPNLDPKKTNYSKFGSTYLTIRYALHLFFLLIFGVTAAVALGYPAPIEKLIPGGVALLFIVMGNLMGRVRHNYFVGFKYPWTLANEEVWKKTHQLGAKLMVLGGFAALLGILFADGNAAFVIMMAGLLIPVAITTVYSYIIYKRIVR